MGLGLNPGGEVEPPGHGRARGGRAEAQTPQGFDRECSAGRILQRADERSCAGIEGVDMAIAQVADQQIAAEGAEARRRLDHRPRGVQRASGGETLDEVAVHVEDVHQAQAGALRLVVEVGRLRVRHVELAADLRDVEWRVVGRQARIDEVAGQRHLVEITIVDVDRAGVEVRHVEVRRRGGACDRRARVLGIREAGDLNRVRRIDERIPGGDGACLGHEDEDRARRAIGARDPEGRIRRGCQHDPGRRSVGDRDDQRANGPIGVVQRGRGGPVIGDPEDAGGADDEPPGVHEVRVCVQRLPREIGDEIDLLVPLRPRGSRGQHHGREKQSGDGGKFHWETPLAARCQCKQQVWSGREQREGCQLRVAWELF